MSTTPTSPAVTAANIVVAATKQSFTAKLEVWFKKLSGEIEAALTDIFGSSVAKDIEGVVRSLMGTALGSVALEAVTAATDVQTGKINVTQATSAIQAAAVASGKTLGNSTLNLLISAAQQMLESKLGITTSTV